MAVDIKFCGLTRPEDARAAALAGARYVGVVFAGGPRKLDSERAEAVLAAAGTDVVRVGVFGHEPIDAIARAVDQLNLDVAQLHGDPSPEHVRSVRALAGRAVWAVARVGPSGELPAVAQELDGVADALLLDTAVEGRLGGGGVPIAWDALAHHLSTRGRPRRPIVLAGGLTAGNVGAAIALVQPDVVDVSSGVERDVGIKDHGLLRAFVRAARGDAGEPRSAAP